METLPLMVLSLTVCLLTILYTAKGSVCPSVPPLQETCCSGLAATNNISDTSVLLEWTVDSNSVSTAQTVVVTYEQINPITINGTIETIRVHNPVSVYNGSSLVLVELKEGSCYLVQVRINGSICCQEVFETQDEDPFNQVIGVRSHRYRPILNSFSIVTAQVTWNDAHASAQVSSYDVRVRTADRSLTEVYNRNFTSQTFFTNIATRTNSNELLYPLKVNSLYIVEVRGRSGSTVYTWSEPLWINTTSNYRMSDLVSSGDDSGQLARLSERNTYDSFVNLHINTRAVAADNMNRVIFYFDKNESSIMEGYLDPPFTKKEVYRFTDISMVTVTAMTYDWISQRLYIAITTPQNFLKLYYIVYDINGGGPYQLTLLRALDKDILDMSINPFTGFLYFTEVGINSDYQLRSLKISSPFDVLTIHGMLARPTVAQSYERSCVYVIGANSSIIVEGSASCSDTDVTLASSTDMYVLAADEISLFAADDSGNLYSYDQRTSKFVLSQTLSFNEAILALAAVSPGAQQLPEQSCLSPEIKSVQLPVLVAERLPYSAYITWNAVSVGVRSECMSVVSSIPPLMYTVEVLYNGVVIQQQTMTDTSWNITDVEPNMNYTVILRVGSSYTIGKPAMFASVMIGTVSDQGTDMSSKPTTSTTSMLLPTQTFTSPPPADFSPDYSMLIILTGSVVGGVVLFTIVCVCCCCCLCLIFKRRNKNTGEVKENGTSTKSTPPIVPTRHYFKKIMSRRKQSPPPGPSSTSLISVKEEDLSQPVYVLPGGDTPVYDINIDQQLEQYDYPQIESAAPVSISARSSPTGRQTRNGSITPLPTPTRQSFDHATYEYPNTLSVGNGTGPAPWNGTRGSIDAGAKSSVRLEETRPSIVSIQSSKHSGVSIEVEDESLYEKLDESVDGDNMVRRGSHPNTDAEVDSDYVYESLTASQTAGTDGNKDKDHDDEDGEYVYAWSGVNDGKSLAGNSPPNGTRQNDDIYETFNENHTTINGTPQPYSVPIQFNGIQPSSVKSSVSVGSFSSITQMPLPSLPSIDSGAGNKNNKQRPKLGREPALTDDSGISPLQQPSKGTASKGEAPLDQAGYLILTSQPSKDSPTTPAKIGDHDSSCHPKLGEAPVDQAGYLVLTSHESVEDQYEEPNLSAHKDHTQALWTALGPARRGSGRPTSSSTSSSDSADSVEEAYEIMTINY